MESNDFLVVNTTGIDSAMSKNVKRRVTLTLTKVYVDALDHLVEEGIYLEHQVVIRVALRHLFRQHKLEPFYSDFVEKVETVQE